MQLSHWLLCKSMGILMLIHRTTDMKFTVYLITWDLFWVSTVMLHMLMFLYEGHAQTVHEWLWPHFWGHSATYMNFTLHYNLRTTWTLMLHMLVFFYSGQTYSEHGWPWSFPKFIELQVWWMSRSAEHGLFTQPSCLLFSTSFPEPSLGLS